MNKNLKGALATLTTLLVLITTSGCKTEEVVDDIPEDIDIVDEEKEQPIIENLPTENDYDQEIKDFLGDIAYHVFEDKDGVRLVATIDLQPYGYTYLGEAAPKTSDWLIWMEYTTEKDDKEWPYQSGWMNIDNYLREKAMGCPMKVKRIVSINDPSDLDPANVDYEELMAYATELGKMIEIKENVIIDDSTQTVTVYFPVKKRD